jgi:hypothetical protein
VRLLYRLSPSQVILSRFSRFYLESSDLIERSEKF